jgi:hypothetical protein
VEPWWVPILVAVIGGPIVALIEKFRRENKRDHGNVMDRLDLISSEIRSDIRQVRGEISDHANGPAHGGAAKPAKMPRKRGPKAG